MYTNAKLMFTGFSLLKIIKFYNFKQRKSCSSR